MKKKKKKSCLWSRMLAFSGRLGAHARPERDWSGEVGSETQMDRMRGAAVEQICNM